MNKEEFDSFFKIHSQNVDNADRLGFWGLTDKVLETYLLESMPNREGVTLVDFGGGTGRWLKKLDSKFTNSKFIIVDLSTDMLAQAKKKVENGDFTNDITLIESDISDIKDLEDNSVDYIISTYNPLSFVSKPQAAINEAYRILKPSGVAMITVQGYYNALYSKLNNSVAEADVLQAIYEDKKVKWNDSVPTLWQLPQSDMLSMFKNSGFNDVECRGIATVIQPQGEDFDPENKLLGSISKKLNEDESFFNTVFEIELNAGKDQQAINRAMNILTIGRK